MKDLSLGYMVDRIRVNKKIDTKARTVIDIYPLTIMVKGFCLE